MVGQETIEEAVKLLLAAAPGSKVILFGSYARGDAKADSDVDFMVVEPQVKDRHAEMVRLAQALRPLMLPVDVVVVPELKPGVSSQFVSVNGIPPDMVIADIGPNTIELFSGELEKCHTVVWNGPLGVYEIPPFDHGTKSLVRVLSSLNDATTIVGGGSSAEVVQEMGLTGKISHVSTGGGATLMFLEGVVLPGVEVLLNK